MVSVFESVMLICFGLSWPMNVMKAYKARTAKGMSFPFIMLIITGYIAGITAKFMSHTVNYVLVVYFLNLAIVSVNLFMYFRNKALDKVHDENEMVVCQSKIRVNKEDFVMKKYENEILKYSALNSLSKAGGIVIFGELEDKEIPITEISEAIEMKEKVYNRSIEELYISAAPEVYDTVISPLCPDTVLLHIGRNDIDFYTRFPGRFDHDYRTLIQHINDTDKNCRIGIVAIKNPEGNEVIERMNNQLKFIAESEECEFCNITSETQWSLSAIKAAYDYYYSTGYANSAKRSIYDIAKIFFGKPDTVKDDRTNAVTKIENQEKNQITA